MGKDTLMNTLLFFIKIALVLAVLFAVQIPVRRSRKKLLRTVVFILKLLLIPTTALLFVAIDTEFVYKTGNFLCAVYTAQILQPMPQNFCFAVSAGIKRRKEGAAVIRK